MIRPSRQAVRYGSAVLLATVGLATAVTLVATRTRPVREAVAAYTRLISAANRQDLPAIAALCSTRYLRQHPLEAAPEGGVVGFPRNVHPNFQAWPHRDAIWLCPTNRTGPVYQFVHEADSWRFDGPVGLLDAQGQVLPLDDARADPPSPPRSLPPP